LGKAREVAMDGKALEVQALGGEVFLGRADLGGKLWRRNV